MARHMTSLIVKLCCYDYNLTVIAFQLEPAETNAEEHTDNQIAKFQIVTPVNDNLTKDHSETAPGLEQPPKYDVVNCAALGCPNNPPNLHGQPTDRCRRVSEMHVKCRKDGRRHC